MIATESTAPTGWQVERAVPPPPHAPNRGEGEPEVDLPRRLRDFSAAYPVVWIAGAVTLGVILGCIVKRR